MVEQRLKERLSSDCPTWGSILYKVSKLGHYCACQEMIAHGSLIWLVPERLCQILTNTEADGYSQPTNGLSVGSQMEELEKGLKELRVFAAPWVSTSVNLPELPGSLPGTGLPTKEYT